MAMPVPNPWSKPKTTIRQRSQVDLEWKPPPVIDGYAIERRTKNTDWIEIARVPPNQYKYSIGNLDADTEYDFRVVALGRGYYQPSQSTGLHSVERPCGSGLTADDVFYKIRTKKALVIGNAEHPGVIQAVKILESHDKTVEVIDLETAGEERENVERAVLQFTCREQFPLVFVKGDCVGDVSNLEKMEQNGVLQEWLRDHEFDLVVIGGGMAGLTVAQEAAAYKKKVVLLDYTVATPMGTTWGLGGTSVNAGCIVKKLMHHAALLGQSTQDARDYGWKFEEKMSHNWDSIRYAIHGHVNTLIGKFRVAVRKGNITLCNGYGKFVGSHKVSAMDKDGKEIKSFSADRFVIASGLRPKTLDIAGGGHCITSDDLLKLAYPPGKTLIIGGSYIALECAGFLHGLGFTVSVMVRSELLRGYDRDMAERIGKQMADSGIRIFHETAPTKIDKIADGKPGRLRVMAKKRTGEEVVSEYNTVVVATGRQAMTDNMGLDAAGIKLNDSNKRIVCLQNEQSVTTPYVYAVGDVLDSGIERTPVAVKVSRLLVRRLFGDGTALCDCTNVPKTVFTPLEYGYCGMTEEDAIEKFTVDNVEVFHIQFNPLELTVPYRKGYELKMPRRKEWEHCYAKLICHKTDDMRVLGLHILGPNAGEITQGFALGLKLNAKKADFDNLMGIHPTVAELFTTLQVTKASKKTFQQGH